MKKKNRFMSATLMCSFLIIAFQVDQEGIKWFRTGQEIVPIILGLSTMIFGSLWFFDSQKYKTTKE